MTPQLQQAIKLLQLSNVELAEYCEQELERNPLLERDDHAPAGDAERDLPEAAAKSETLDTELAREDFSKVADLDGAAHDNLYDGDAPQSPGPRDGQPLTDWSTVKSSNTFDGDEDLLESTLAAGGIGGPMAHFGDFLLAGHFHGDLDKIAYDRINFASNIAHFSELGGFDLDEGGLGQPRQSARNLGLADPGRTDHEDVMSPGGRNF